jgi:hypothetical protein
MQYYELKQPFTPIQLTLFYRVSTKAITYCFCELDFEDDAMLLIRKESADLILELVNKEFNKQFQEAPFGVTIDELLAYIVPLAEDSMLLGKIGYSLTLGRSKRRLNPMSKIIHSSLSTNWRDNSITFFD